VIKHSTFFGEGKTCVCEKSQPWKGKITVEGSGRGGFSGDKKRFGKFQGGREASHGRRRGGLHVNPARRKIGETLWGGSRYFMGGRKGIANLLPLQREKGGKRSILYLNPDTLKKGVKWEKGFTTSRLEKGGGERNRDFTDRLGREEGRDVIFIDFSTAAGKRGEGLTLNEQNCSPGVVIYSSCEKGERGIDFFVLRSEGKGKKQSVLKRSGPKDSLL